MKSFFERALRSSKIRTLFPLIVLLCCFSSATAQPRPNVPHDVPFYYAFPLLTHYPPLNTGMPYDVLIGYIGFDSLARSIDHMLVDGLAHKLTYSDTMRIGAKFLYKLVDYDPLRFTQWSSTQLTPTMYGCIPGRLRLEFAHRLDTLAPNSMHVRPLLFSDYILHVRVLDTLFQHDSSAVIANSCITVTATVLDTIKGRVLPRCSDSPLNLNYTGAASTVPPEQCFQFEYRKEWRRLNHSLFLSRDDSTLADLNGKTWAQPGKEYIVFLRFENFRRDSVYNFATLIPVRGWGSMVCLYPIIDGKVYDPYDDFGFGLGLTPEQFKAALRGEIQSILNP